MVKTRSQTRDITIKKEEEDCKPLLVLHSVRITPRSGNKITKRRSSRNKNNLPAQQIKVEENTDIKSLLETPLKFSELPKGRQVSQEQINQLIDAIVNENMSVTRASRKAKVAHTTGSYYYNIYRNDPDKKIPSPRKGYKPKTHSVFTQEHVENLIRYIVDDKMSIEKASSKANVGYRSARFYYKKYLDDPAHKIPIPYSSQLFTQDQSDAFIGYIVNDKMSIREASRKINMCFDTARAHYYQYLKDNNMEVPAPKVIRPCTQEDKDELIRLIFEEKMPIKAAARKVPMYYSAALKHYHQYVKDHNLDMASPKYAQDQINQLIGYIIDDKMNIKAASTKANMSRTTGKKYYLQYLNDNHLDLPGPKYTQDQKNELIDYIANDKMSIIAAARRVNMSSTIARKLYRKYLIAHNLDLPTVKHINQDQKNELIGYVVDDKMSIYAASKKAKMSFDTGKKYYLQYLKDHNLEIPVTNYTSPEQIDESIGYIVDDKMTVKAASKKAKICEATARKYYYRYLKDHNMEIPSNSTPQDQINELIGYIVDDKMSIKAASEKANMSVKTGRKYYQQYLKDHNLPVPVPKSITQDQINELIGYIVDDKMSVRAASKKANMTCTTGSKYYHRYLNAQKRNGSTRRRRGDFAPKNA